MTRVWANPKPLRLVARVVRYEFDNCFEIFVSQVGQESLQWIFCTEFGRDGGMVDNIISKINAAKRVEGWQPYTVQSQVGSHSLFW